MNAFKIQLLQKGLDNMNTGAKIKKLRKEYGYSQEQLGSMLGVQRAAVQKWPAGRHLHRLCPEGNTVGIAEQLKYKEEKNV